MQFDAVMLVGLTDAQKRRYRRLLRLTRRELTQKAGYEEYHGLTKGELALEVIQAEAEATTQ